MKVKILKKPRKHKKVDKSGILKSTQNKKQTTLTQTKVNQSYLNYYDDIKIPSQKYDW